MFGGALKQGGGLVCFGGGLAPPDVAIFKASNLATELRVCNGIRYAAVFNQVYCIPASGS